MALLKSTVITGALRVTGKTSLGIIGDNLYLDTGKNIYMKYSNTDYGILRNPENGNITVNAASGGLYLGYLNTSKIYFYYNTSDVTSSAKQLGILLNTGLTITPVAATNAQQSSGLVIDTTLRGSSGAAALELYRGTDKSSWQLLNSAGTFYIRNNWDSTNLQAGNYTKVALTMESDSGNSTFGGTITGASPILSKAKGDNPWPGILFSTTTSSTIYTLGDATWGSIYALGSGTKVSDSTTLTPRMTFRIFSPTAAGSVTATSHREDYVLPYVDINRNTDIIYEVLTTKTNTKMFYGTCSTAAATTTKNVTCSTFTSNDLVPGVSIWVKFSVTNSVAADTVQLLINNIAATAKNIKRYGNAAIANMPGAGYLLKDALLLFVYDGTYWVLSNIQYNTNTNTLLRTYALSSSTALPIVGAATTTAGATDSYTSSYKDSYGGIPSTVANRATIVPSTGKMTVPGGIDIGKSTDTYSQIRSLYGLFLFNTAKGINYAGMETATTDASRDIWFADSGTVGVPVHNSNFLYNPSSGLLKVGGGVEIADLAKFEYNSTDETLDLVWVT